MANSYNLAQKRLTRRSIIEALLLIATTKPIETITVRELCLRAGVSRMAFYRHFHDLHEVLRGHFHDQQSEFLSWLRKQPETDLSSIGLRFLEIIERERGLFAAVFEANLHWIVADYLESGVSLFREEFQPLPYRSPREREYLVAFEAGGFLAIVSKWLARECREPKEEILSYLVKGSDSA